MPSTQYDRRHTPYPTTWELPATAALTCLLLLALTTHIGRGIATLLGAGQWTWPRNIFQGLVGILTGDAAAGLAPHLAPAITTAHISPVLLLVTVTVTDVLALTGAAALTIWLWKTYGPGQIKGMATKDEAEAILGVSRLRKQRHIIRPDLYTKPRRPFRLGR